MEAINTHMDRSQLSQALTIQSLIVCYPLKIWLGVYWETPHVFTHPLEIY